jgi:hypothetical protein
VQRISITESRGGIAKFVKTDWTFRTYPNGESVENNGIALGDRLLQLRPQASALKPASGISPEG